MKPFAWSYSKLKNYETCPFKFLNVDIQKLFTDTSEQMTWGNEVHAKLALACAGKEPLPPTMSIWQKWVDPITAAVKKFPDMELLTEQKYALTRQLQPAEWFGPNVWVRAIGDLVLLGPTKAMVWDWKTGRVVADSPQLMLLAQCVFSFHPTVQEVDTSFIWLKEGTETQETYTREDCDGAWVNLLERVARMEQSAKFNNYPHNPSGLCKRHCPVTTCPYHGKGGKP